MPELAPVITVYMPFFVPFEIPPLVWYNETIQCRVNSMSRVWEVIF